MKLSNRLLTIAGFIPANSYVIDVGCDHALLSIYLEQEKNCTCLATDINEGALDNAKRNIKKYKSNIKIKQTDGLEGITINDSDYIVIAGMGTTTIKHILDNKKLSKHLIISSNSQVEELREYVTSIGFYIDDEKFVVDHEKKYIVINFKKGKKRYTKTDIQHGPILKNNLEYLTFELDRLFKIKEEVQNGRFTDKYRNNKEIKKVMKLISNLDK